MITVKVYIIRLLSLLSTTWNYCSAVTVNIFTRRKGIRHGQPGQILRFKYITFHIAFAYLYTNIHITSPNSIPCSLCYTKKVFCINGNERTKKKFSYFPTHYAVLLPSFCWWTLWKRKYCSNNQIWGQTCLSSDKGKCIKNTCIHTYAPIKLSFKSKGTQVHKYLHFIQYNNSKSEYNYFSLKYTLLGDWCGSQ